MKHLERIKMMNCVLCGEHCPSDAHHIRTGQGMAQKASDYLAIPLCKPCHQGDLGIHGDRTLLRIHKKTELDLLATTIETIMKAKHGD